MPRMRSPRSFTTRRRPITVDRLQADLDQEVCTALTQSLRWKLSPQEEGKLVLLSSSMVTLTSELLFLDTVFQHLTDVSSMVQ